MAIRVGIVDDSGSEVVSYTYDAWGNILSTTGSMASTLGALNPLRYRGYVYDEETNLYYLQSRYYDPEMGRFINADVFTSTGQGTLGSNMYAYCLNNPVRYTDDSGYFVGYVKLARALISGLINAIISAMSTAATGGDLTEVLISAAVGFISGVVWKYLWRNY